MLAWHLGARYLRRRRTAWLALAAVTLSVAIPVIVVGVMQGFVEITSAQVRGSECDISIFAGGELSELPLDQQFMDEVAAIDGVLAIAPYSRRDSVITPQLGYGDESRFNAGCQAEGVRWAEELATKRITHDILHPRPSVDLNAPPLAIEERGTGFLTPTWRAHLAVTGLDIAQAMGTGFIAPPRKRPRPGAILGRELIYSYGDTLFRMGRPISFTIPDGYGGKVGSVNAEVSDTIGTGVHEFDRTRVLLPFEYGRHLAGMRRRDTVSGYRVAVTESADVESVHARLSELYPRLDIRSWKDLSSRNILKTF